MRTLFVSLLTFLSAPLLAAPILFLGECPVVLEPASGSRKVCQLKAGTEVDVRRVDAVWSLAETTTCRGFIETSCARRAVALGARNRVPASENVERHRDTPTTDLNYQPWHRPTLGVRGVFSWNMTAPDGQTTTEGLGYGGALRVGFPVGRRWELGVAVGYEDVNLDPLRRMQAAQVEVGLRFRQAPDDPIRYAVLGMEVGVVGLHRVKMNIAPGATEPLRSYALFYIGPNVDIPTSAGSSLILGANGYYNVLSKSSDRLYGARATLSFLTNL